MFNIPKNSRTRILNNYIWSIIVVFLMIILPMLNISAPTIENPIKKLGNGSSEEIITFPNGGGYNNELNLTLPEGAIITSAEMELQGLGVQGVLQKYTHTYSDTVNNNAWKGVTTQHPPTSTPSTFSTTAFSNTEYSNVRLSDNVRALHSAKGANNYPYHLFKFKVAETGITNLEVNWEGYGYFNGISIWPYWAYLYIWDDNNTSWELVGSNSTNINPIDFIIQKKSFTNHSDYIDSTRFLYLMAQGPDVADNMSSSDIYTDFIKLVITGMGTSFPTNPTLNIGDDDDNEWEFSGIFDQKVIIDDDKDFKSELQSLIDLATPGIKQISIPLNITSLTEGKIKICNISISYEFPEINLPPELVKDIPNGTLGFYEDTDGGDDLIDLNDYFWDDRDNGTLKFVILKNNEDVHAELDTDSHHLDFSSEVDYFGTSKFQVRAFDKGLDGILGHDEDLYTDSKVFEITVWPTNDAPVIDSVGGVQLWDGMTELKYTGSKRAKEDEWFNLTVLAHDIDGDVLSFSSNITLSEPAKLYFVSDPMNNIIANLAIYATNDYVGMLYLRIIVSDNNESGKKQPGDPSIGPLTDSLDLTIQVQNSNDAPELMPIGDISCYEDSWFNFSLSATDDDSIFDEKLTFSTNITTAIDGLINSVNYEFNEDSGEISILPDNDMVDHYWVKFEVKDFIGKSDSEAVLLVVNNVNDPPFPAISSPSTKQVFNTTTSIQFDATESTDDDLIHGDILSYQWSSNLSGVLSTNPNFSTNLSDIGWHEITLTVSDSHDVEVQEYVVIRITATPEEPDNKKDDKDGPDVDGKNKPDKAGENLFSENMMVAIIAVILVIIILILLFLWQRKRLKDKSEVDPEESADTPRAGIITDQVQVVPVPQPPLQVVYPPPMTWPGQPQPIVQPIQQPLPQTMPMAIAPQIPQMAQPLTLPPMAEQQQTPEPLQQPPEQPQQSQQPTQNKQSQQNPSSNN